MTPKCPDCNKDQDDCKCNPFAWHEKVIEALRKENEALRAERETLITNCQAYTVQINENWYQRQRLESEIEALKAYAERWLAFSSSPQTALMLGSKLDPNSQQDWEAECNRLADKARGK